MEITQRTNQETRALMEQAGLRLHREDEPGIYVPCPDITVASDPLDRAAIRAELLRQIELLSPGHAERD